MKTNIKEFLKKVKSIFILKERYVVDKSNLLLVKDNMIKKMSIVFLTVVVILIGIICVQHQRTIEHIERAQEHYEHVTALQDSIAEQKYAESEISLYTEIGIISVLKDCEPCTQENICEYIDYLHEIGVVWFPEIIKSNCQMESGFGQSEVAKKYNNLFGMDHPNVRQSLSMHRSGRFATFKNWKCSVLDRVLWDYNAFSNKIPTEKQYMDKMNHVYNVEERDYYKLLVDCTYMRNKNNK